MIRDLIGRWISIDSITWMLFRSFNGCHDADPGTLSVHILFVIAHRFGSCVDDVVQVAIDL